MHVTLHLTNNCNMECDYCYVNHGEKAVMPLETAKKAVDLAIRTSKKKPAGIIYFGGEPLLHKDLIRQTTAYAKSKGEREGVMTHFKLTTNGLLLDEEFLRYAKNEGVFIALSHDGVRPAHDAHRRDSAGGTFERLEGIAKRLLYYQPYSPVMMTINPDTACYYFASVNYLYNLGFKYIVCSLNYAGRWNKNSFKELKKQYGLLSKWYMAHTLNEDKFYLSPFETKIASHILGSGWCVDRCELGIKQVSVNADGNIYPCVQFVGDDGYLIGNVYKGINWKKQLNLYAKSSEAQEECKSCTIKNRCLNTCGCLNRQVTGRIDRVAPSLCQNERILMPIADRTAEKLYKRRSAIFIQKHYNDLYPVISMVEDRAEKYGARV